MKVVLTRHQQWCDHITTEQLVGLTESLKCLLVERWMVHEKVWTLQTIAWGDENHPFYTCAPATSPNQHWRDVITADLKMLDVPLKDVYDLTRN